MRSDPLSWKRDLIPECENLVRGLAPVVPERLLPFRCECFVLFEASLKGRQSRLN
jgi:hypothetical protein